MRGDLPAPFSPMSEWISPPRRRKSTLSRASTPGKRMVMPVIWTIGGTSVSAGMVIVKAFQAPASAHPPGAEDRPPASVCVCLPDFVSGSVQTRVDDLGRLLRREALVLHVDRLLDVLSCQHVIHEPGCEFPEER